MWPKMPDGKTLRVWFPRADWLNDTQVLELCCPVYTHMMQLELDGIETVPELPEAKDDEEDDADENEEENAYEQETEQAEISYVM